MNRRTPGSRSASSWRRSGYVIRARARSFSIISVRPWRGREASVKPAERQHVLSSPLLSFPLRLRQSVWRTLRSSPSEQPKFGDATGASVGDLVARFLEGSFEEEVGSNSRARADPEPSTPPWTR
ncbi:hypothetical protein OJAV_G00121530 [Oryzias javanicus]|uniref:Uncharacterized protein n=1 Tax=Oryzias javanicus TaxID=123683 RepID=A0A437CVB9_ORYJA|nr:hypothetical protein OJAV_G00121530 [Oryzias javanicus]